MNADDIDKIDRLKIDYQNKNKKFKKIQEMINESIWQAEQNKRQSDKVLKKCTK